jgi:sulfur-oxidizing protein SoxY
MRAAFLAMALIGAATLGSTFAAITARADDAAERAERWDFLRGEIFGDRALADGAGIVALEAPDRALDAALVPVTVTLSGDDPVTAVYVVVDQNPGPLAAHVTFGPAAQAQQMTFRVRVNEYTYIHAVAETASGALYQTAKFVKAAGGCSAPVGADAEAALADIGRMKLRLAGEIAFGQPVEAQLMIRHPNFNGMQMDQLTRMYTPARYIDAIDVTYDGQQVFHLVGDISLSTDPVIGFSFVPPARGKLHVVVRDTDGATFEESFDLPLQGS